MRAGLLLTIAALALTACGPSAERPVDAPGADSGQSTELACATFADLTQTNLVERYGAENVTTETLSGMEGETYEATFIYANDLARKIEIVWNASNAANILVHGTQWTGPGGLHQGASMPDVERINGRAFKFWGFGWDYGGWVSDWGGGALAERDGCMTRVHFDARDLENAGALGDSEFMSDAAGAQNGEPYVTGFGFAFTD